LARNTLLVRAGALGDVLLLRRAVAALRRDGGRVLLIAPASAGAAIVGPGPSEVDELVAWDTAEVARLFVAEAGLAGRLRERLVTIDLALVYSRSDVLARNLGRVVPRVVSHDPVPAGGLHASRWLARPLDALGLGTEIDPEPMRATAAEAAEARRVLSALPETFLAVHPGSGSPAKSWPPERFAALLDVLAPPGAWLLVEGPADAAPAAALAQRPGAVVARALPPRMLGAVLSHAALFVGNDSGVSHLAAAWGAPTLVLFGPTDPAVWAPVGPHVSVLRAPEGRMDALAVEAVVAAARATLSGRAHPSG